MRCATLLLAVVLAGCGPAATGPEPLVFGEDGCEGCRMIISEARTAAQARSGGRVEKFDDIGCLLRRREANPGAESWVADWNTGAWLTVDSAWFVHAPKLKTPMGWGLAAFASSAAAEAFAREQGGRVLRQDGLRDVPRPR